MCDTVIESPSAWQELEPLDVEVLLASLKSPRGFKQAVCLACAVKDVS